MVKRSISKKSAPAKKKAAPRKKASVKKKVVKRKAPAKKRASKRTSTKRKAPSRKSSTAKKKASSRKSLSKADTLHKDGHEQFTTSDELFENIVNHAGRPTVYTKTLARKICLLISMGYSLTKITSYSDMPCMATVCKWLNDEEGKPELIEWYSRARESQIDIVEDRVMDICMNVPKVPLTVGKDGDILWMDGERIMVNHPANVALAKLQTDSHYKFLGSLRAKKWGRDSEVGALSDGLLEMMDIAAGRLVKFKEKEGALIDNNTGEVVED